MEKVTSDHITILNRIAMAGERMHFGENASVEEIELAAQLLDRGFVQGFHVVDEEDRPCRAVITGIALKGRAYVSV